MIKKTVKIVFLWLTLTNNISLFASDAPWTQLTCSLIPSIGHSQSSRQIRLTEIGPTTRDLRIRPAAAASTNPERAIMLAIMTYFEHPSRTLDVWQTLDAWENLENSETQAYIRAIIQYALIHCPLCYNPNNSNAEILMLLEARRHLHSYMYDQLGATSLDRIAHAEAALEGQYRSLQGNFDVDEHLANIQQELDQMFRDDTGHEPPTPTWNNWLSREAFRNLFRLLIYMLNYLPKLAGATFSQYTRNSNKFTRFTPLPALVQVALSKLANTEELQKAEQEFQAFSRRQ